MPTGPELAGAIIFISVIVISFLVKERLYPFSVLSMFAYRNQYKKQLVPFFTDETDQQVIATPLLIGSPTSGLSREYDLWIAQGGSLEGFVGILEEHIQRVSPQPLAKTYHFWVWEISVDKSGGITKTRKLLPVPLLLSTIHGKDNIRRSTENLPGEMAGGNEEGNGEN